MRILISLYHSGCVFSFFFFSLPGNVDVEQTATRDRTSQSDIRGSDKVPGEEGRILTGSFDETPLILICHERCRQNPKKKKKEINWKKAKHWPMEGCQICATDVLCILACAQWLHSVTVDDAHLWTRHLFIPLQPGHTLIQKLRTNTALEKLVHTRVDDLFMQSGDFLAECIPYHSIILLIHVPENPVCHSICHSTSILML